MRSRVQVSLPLPTKNQALASMQVLFFYPFSGFITKFAPPLQRIAAASVHRVPPTHLQKNCKKVAKNQPYASARHLCGSLWREPLKGASLGPLRESLRAPLRAPLREFLEEPLLGAFWRAFWGSLCGHLCGRNKKPVLEGRVPHTNINNTNNAMAEFSAFCFRYKGRTKRIMGQSPQLSIFVRVNSPDLGSKPPRYR